MTLPYPAIEFAAVVALILEAAHGEEADLSEVRIVRSERGPYVYFETRTPQAFLGTRRVRADDLRRALSDKLDARTCNSMSAVRRRNVKRHSWRTGCVSGSDRMSLAAWRRSRHPGQVNSAQAQWEELLQRAQELGSREGGLAVVVTERPDSRAQASVVNAGTVAHPVTGELSIGFVVQGATRRKLANLRARPVATVVFRSGWEWVTIEGDVDLIGPHDELTGLDAKLVPRIFHDIYSVAIGGSPDDWAARDGAIEREGHTAVLVRPVRVYSSSPHS